MRLIARISFFFVVLSACPLSSAFCQENSENELLKILVHGDFNCQDDDWHEQALAKDKSDGYFLITTKDNPSNVYDTQFRAEFTRNLKLYSKVVLSMVVKADVETFICVEHHALPGMCVKFDTSNGLFIGTDWDTVYYNLVVTDESVQALVFDMSCSDNSNNIYIKNVECTCSEPLMLTSDSISSGSAVKDLDFVDMGSGIRWATHNVGAFRPEGNGLYVGWGDNTTHHSYNWPNYCYNLRGGISMSKYNDADKRSVLEKADDFAYICYKGDWCTPTEQEWLELFSNSEIRYGVLNGIPGIRLRSKINGNSIFLPSSGFKDTELKIGDYEYGFYWTSTLDEKDCTNAKCVEFTNGSYGIGSVARYSGMLIRPIIR